MSQEILTELQTGMFIMLLVKSALTIAICYVVIKVANHVD